MNVGDTRGNVRASNLLVDLAELHGEVVVEHAAALTPDERRDWERLGQLLEEFIAALQKHGRARVDIGDVSTVGYEIKLIEP